jgi:hypothetical protein
MFSCDYFMVCFEFHDGKPTVARKQIRMDADIKSLDLSQVATSPRPATGTRRHFSG